MPEPGENHECWEKVIGRARYRPEIETSIEAQELPEEVYIAGVGVKLLARRVDEAARFWSDDCDMNSPEAQLEL